MEHGAVAGKLLGLKEGHGRELWVLLSMAATAWITCRHIIHSFIWCIEGMNDMNEWMNHVSGRGLQGTKTDSSFLLSVSLSVPSLFLSRSPYHLPFWVSLPHLSFCLYLSPYQLSFCLSLHTISLSVSLSPYHLSFCPSLTIISLSVPLSISSLFLSLSPHTISHSPHIVPLSVSNSYHKRQQPTPMTRENHEWNEGTMTSLSLSCDRYCFSVSFRSWYFSWAGVMTHTLDVGHFKNFMMFRFRYERIIFYGSWFFSQC